MVEKNSSPNGKKTSMSTSIAKSTPMVNEVENASSTSGINGK